MYDVIVVGGGHAGIEAALAAARMGAKTVLITGKLDRVGAMSCNPSIGGPAKGIVVREIDALGGQMARSADKGQIQMKMLNLSKGPAVWALRAQIDKLEYPKIMLDVLKQTENLDLLEALVDEMIVLDNVVKGVRLENKDLVLAHTVIITTGTYLSSKILIGHDTTQSGPDNQPTTFGISGQLARLGFELVRLKTGTPPRILKSSIHYDLTTPQYADDKFQTFSYDPEITTMGHQEPCYLTHTNLLTHGIINLNLGASAMYGGIVEGVGPRYCPSIEDKVVRFSDKDRHQIFLEPESLSLDEIYVQGLSSSMPKDVQAKIVHSIKGLEDAVIVRYAYAIEYDAINPTQLYQSLETRIIENLFCAGQINGTSGYEEAAGQGLMAGINAVLKLRGEKPFILKRNEAYIGVLIDDLITKGTKEPYRLLTSRAEHRLLLRHDNADLRLRDYGHQLGLLDDARYQKYLKKKNEIEQLKHELKDVYIMPTEENNLKIRRTGSTKISDRTSLFDLLKRPEIRYNMINEFYPNDYSEEVLEQVEIQVKYAGYIDKANKEAEKMIRVDEKPIPNNIDYDQIRNLAIEARDKFKKIRPTTLGQASRISGVNPSDVSILLVYLESLR
ncbi:MAG: tRNA uridine-5-carboxymethylaminomethyl(34) synthesis enzyme MnmG [Acholeplasma sp.]|jgi:tRNA uridine 5-carboxymethylaminomethyl modification enzyme|nr:tRNA uridine-5-carboxymethylaminomethyl(34) synthesis enzyme MnmG [Acholeplasma sp.]